MGRGRVYTYRYTDTTRITCIKMGSDESHFNVSFSNCERQSQDRVHKPQLLKRKESRAVSNRSPSAYQPTALPLVAACVNVSK